MASLLNWFGGASKPPVPAAPPGRCLKRVARDVATVRRDHATNLFAEQREAVATTVDCVVCGPEGTPYYGGLFHFRVEHPHSYPVENPTCTNLTTGQGRIGFNPNLYRTGKVCMSILGTWVGPGWNPSHSLSSVLLSIQSLMNDQPYCNEPGREGVSRDDPNNKAYDAFLKYATLKFACVDVLDPAKATSAEPLPAAAKRFCAKRFLERYDKIIEMVDAEIKAGTSGRLKDPSRASALGLGPVDYKGLRVDLAKRKAEAEALLAQPEEEDDEPAVEAKEEPSTPPREAP